VGRDADLVAQIVEKAREPQMQAMVPKDMRDRFESPESFEAWYAKRRFLFALMEQGELAQIVWHGKSSFANEIASLRKKGAAIDFEAADGTDHTMALRVYEGFSGMPRPEGEEMSFARRGLAEGHQLYAQSVRQAGETMLGQTVWIETNLNNKRGERNNSVYLYEKFGYGAVGTYTNPDPTNPEERVALVRPLGGVQGTLILPEAA
jgi:hypothetical protein